VNEENIIKKRKQISKRIQYLDYLTDNDLITISKFTKSRQKLIAELHTLDFVLGKQEDVDSTEWFKELEGNNE
jgi:hypothetical protein